ncbi:hypothetical protein K488DRAFT_62120 [Vararia minispora EC-137]|uniref:Uncharacterized protein n=1 Tax=Vararia minispora EC-137 TaxID=1314806 RepID=A0ACB8Q6F8_9AGAM|nr:hypothetical protein K488DRAFT_62120 [Vararia minispora EC-137]
MFYLDLIDNLPRLRQSDDSMSIIIWVLRQLGVSNVPSLHQLRKFQASLAQDVGLSAVHHISALNNNFFTNHPTSLIALDFANPLVRHHMRFYPEVAIPASEFWHGEKWLKELDPDNLSPMWADFKHTPSYHFFIKELCQLTNGTLVIPIKWFTKQVSSQSTTMAEVYLVSYSPETNVFSLADSNVQVINTSDLKHNLVDLQNSELAQWKTSSFFSMWWLCSSLSKHPARILADGRPVFVVRVMPWSDDVSGNVSKQYNSHTNIYIQNLGISHRLLQQEYYVRFVSTSPYASSTEQFAALDHDLCSWTEAYDCVLECPIIFRLAPHVFPADNPQQSESSSHIGVKGYYNSRRDLVGGTDENKESEMGYQSLYSVSDDIGTLRHPEETKLAIEQQLRAACTGNADAVEQLIRESGVKDKLAEHWIEILLQRARADIKIRLQLAVAEDSYLKARHLSKEERKLRKIELKNEVTRGISEDLWDWLVKLPEKDFLEDNCNGVNIHRDTPLEILHSILLGTKKYDWHETTSKNWSSETSDLFAVRLQSASVDGLTSPSPRATYIVKYKNSLIGTHFKSLQELGIFALYGQVSNEILQLWKTSGELAALLWIHEIWDYPQYLADLDTAVNNYLDKWADLDPRRIITKIKLRTLLYAHDDIKRFGPSILYSTETFECYNSVFRKCSILFNHLSPSRDIAATISDMERFKHMISGGWWKDRVTGQWIQAGSIIRGFLASNTEMQRRLGWADMSKMSPGTVKLHAQGKQHKALWLNIPFPSFFDPQTAPEIYHTREWLQCKHLIARSHDICVPQSWVFYGSPEKPECGRIFSILKTNTPPDECVSLIKIYTILDQRDPTFSMPVLKPVGQAKVIATKDVLFKFNAQHACHIGNCTIGESSTHVQQERLDTEVQHKVVLHNTLDCYIINMHSLHNGHLLRRALPRHLTQPQPSMSSDERTAAQKRHSEELQVSGPKKRALAKAKAAETRQRNKEAAQSTAARMTVTAALSHIRDGNEEGEGGAAIGTGGDAKADSADDE